MIISSFVTEVLNENDLRMTFREYYKCVKLFSKVQSSLHIS